MNKIADTKQLMAAVSIIPDSAPFDPQQRAWLNGFFAGMTGIEEMAAAADASRTPDSTSIVEPEEEFPWHDDSLAIDQRMGLADGKPIERQLMAAMAQLDCGSCGYLCQTYSEAIASGEEPNLALCTPGGKETLKVVKQLVKLNGSVKSSNSASPKNSVEETGYSRKNPFSAKLIRSLKITGDESAKDVRHVEIDLEGSELTYEVGDALGLYPTNCGELVERVLGNCTCTLDSKHALETLLTRDLANVPDELCELVAAAASKDDDRKRLNQLVEVDDRLDELDVLDFLQMFESVQIDDAALIESLPRLNPRLYSIASSHNRHPGQVHLTVGKVGTTIGQRLRKGVASTLLAERVDPGSELKVFVHKSHGFTVPQNDDAPMIMVGPGTGIAPFLAFLQEREVRGAVGKNWLFFGDQRSESDFLYQDELLSYLDSKLLTRLDTAFSRDQEHKIYVQDRMQENAAEIFQWLQSGGSFFVCGDAKRMAKDVDVALHEIVRNEGGCSVAESQDYVKRLKNESRYMRDVY